MQCSIKREQVSVLLLHSLFSGSNLQLHFVVVSACCFPVLPPLRVTNLIFLPSSHQTAFSLRSLATTKFTAAEKIF